MLAQLDPREEEALCIDANGVIRRRNKLGPTIVPFGRYLWLPFKPPGYQNEFNKMADEQIQTMNKVDHLVGWTIVIAALTYFIVR